MQRFSKTLATLTLSFALIGVTIPVSAQEVLPEDFAPQASQVDITGGLADRSAQYGAQAAGIPMSSQNFQAPAYAQPAAPIQPNYSQSPCQQVPMGANLVPGMYNQPGQCYQQVPQQAMQCGVQYNQPQQSQQQEPSLLGGLSTQAVGLMGAAAVFHLMTNGGMDGLMGEMKARGFNNRFTTRGSCIGGNL